MTGRTVGWFIVQEVRHLLLSRWIGGATALLFVSSAFSAALGTRDFREHMESYRRHVQQPVEAQVRSEGRVWGRTPEPGLRVVRPPTPGAVLAAGMEPVLPAAWEFTPAGSETLGPYAGRDAAVNRNVGDPSSVIAGLGGLLALWLGVSTVLSDRASGRSAALRSLPVSPRTTAVVRLAGAAVALSLVGLGWCLTVILTLALVASTDVTIPAVIPLSMAAPAASYLALMFALGTVAGGTARAEISALITAFVIWIAVVFVVPQANQLITRSLVDVPAQTNMEGERRDQFADEMRLLENEIGLGTATQWQGQPRPNAKEQEAAYFKVGEPIWLAGISRLRELADRREREWVDTNRRAEGIQRWLDRVNPRWWLFESMAEIAGTGRSTGTDWTSAIHAHTRVLNRQLFDDRPRVNARAPWNDEVMAMAFDRHPAPRYSDLASFEPPLPNVGWTPAALRSVAGLVAYMLLAMAGAYFSVRSRSR